MSLREQRGEDDSSYSRQRAQNRCVAPLGYLSRVVLRDGERVDENLKTVGDLLS